ncbi:phage tail protein (plasmid) [Chromobacterium amazonense]|uniref:phage tail protein n=1 Tax=Chromobacterium amazonense TaxID=1382803 RepID=UPI00237E57D9|nr:phage tail protein [Chromobacterium amazonense]MDE1713882.1 phage tail protein [Chromobacterium amazonense]
MQDQLKPITSPDGLFHDGNPATGELGTIVTSDWLNGVQSAVQTTQQELLSVIKSNGQNPDPARKDQLLQAVQNIAWGGNQKPTTLAGYGITDGASKADLQSAVSNLVAGAPGALNTLQELAAALGNDANFAASIAKLLAGKADRASTLAGYGISDGATSTQVNAAAPAGMVAYFAMPQAPNGWLAADGRAVSRKDYPALFAALGTIYGIGDGSTTFILPNLCGEFIRGWDANRGIDAGRNFGSWQKPSAMAHEVGNGNLAYSIDVAPNNLEAAGLELATRNGFSNQSTGFGVIGTWDTQNYGNVFSNGFANPHASPGSNTTQWAGAIDNWLATVRPRNIALLACIKY